jgi:hypothetical protein
MTKMTVTTRACNNSYQKRIGVTDGLQAETGK